MLTILHIEKAAGTSLREYLYAALGRSSIFWWGIDAPATSSRADLQSGKPVIGGHKALHQYKSNADRAFVACVRDPFDRAISFYSYICRVERQAWEVDGFDPDSFENTLMNCPRFRDSISNRQAWYFAKSRKFSDAAAVIEAGQFLVGTVESINSILEILAKELGTSAEPAPRSNEGPPEYRTAIDTKPAIVEEIEEMNREDRALYDSIRARNTSIINNINSDWWAQLRDKLVIGYLRARLTVVELRRVTVTARSGFEVDLLLTPGQMLPGRREETLFVGGRLSANIDGEVCRSEQRVPVAKGYFREELTFYRLSFSTPPGATDISLALGIVDTEKKEWLPPDQLHGSLLTFDH